MQSKTPIELLDEEESSGDNAIKDDNEETKIKEGEKEKKDDKKHNARTAKAADKKTDEKKEKPPNLADLIQKSLKFEEDYQSMPKGGEKLRAVACCLGAPTSFFELNG